MPDPGTLADAASASAASTDRRLSSIACVKTERSQEDISQLFPRLQVLPLCVVFSLILIDSGENQICGCVAQKAADSPEETPDEPSSRDIALAEWCGSILRDVACQNDEVLSGRD